LIEPSVLTLHLLCLNPKYDLDIVSIQSRVNKHCVCLVDWARFGSVSRWEILKRSLYMLIYVKLGLRVACYLLNVIRINPYVDYF
jgi:hypothetical protein